MANTTHKKKNHKHKSKQSNKGLFIGLGIVFAICILFLIIYPMFQEKHPAYGVGVSKLNPATQAIINDSNYANTISDEALNTKISNKDDFFVYMYAATCQYCLQTTPVLMPLADELNVHIDQFNLLEYKEYQAKLNITSTPTLVYFEDGVEKDRIVGGVATNSATGNTVEDFRGFLEKYNVQ